MSVAILLALAYPVLHLRTGITDITAFPDSIDGVAGIKLLNEKWPQGTELSLQIVVTNADRADTKAAIEKLKTEGLKLAGLSQPVDVISSKDGKVALVSFTMAGGRNDEANRQLVRQARTRARTVGVREPARRPRARHRRRRVQRRRDQGLRRRGAAHLRVRPRACHSC